MTETFLGKLIGSGATANVYEYGQGKVCKLYGPNTGSAEYEYLNPPKKQEMILADVKTLLRAL